MNQDETPSPTASTSQSVQLNLQNAMPIITQNRSRELIYDTLQGNTRFIHNPYGPQILALSRNNHRWN